ncbi:MAG: serine/threonine protein kinase, partial [Anaerolineae bacterium]|nr:serine/threonine protein kinase [Anaerolineae bacterium]
MDTHLIGQNIAGYIVRRNIGIGGMGRVYQGIDVTNDRPVAVKILLPEFAEDEQFRIRFMREAELMVTLRHPHVVDVYDHGNWRGYLYIVMQLIRGPSLERILTHHRFSPLSAWQIIQPLTVALGYGHTNKVLHRDLKTANVLIER